MSLKNSQKSIMFRHYLVDLVLLLHIIIDFVQFYKSDLCTL